mmetsp:Transcript_2947/g.2538  ORF Transcript_2947/g.2538 Transcript_2947/m.2538 type:complete len:222 (+) Transcript_2947:1745-2410(+)
MLFVRDLGSNSLLFDGDQIGRDSVAPPELSTDAPILETFSPLEPILFEDIGNDLEFFCLDAIDHLVSDFSLAIYVPLGSQQGLNNITRSLAETESHDISLLSSVKSLSFQILDNLVSDIESLHTFVRTTILVDSTIIVQNIDKFELISQTTIAIVVIVSRGDLDGTSTEFLINKDIISDNSHFSSRDEGMDELLSNKILISGISRVNSNSNITQHGLNTGG